MRHALKRTNPIGQKFIGVCMNCGKENLTLKDSEDCPNPSGRSQDESLLRAIRGDS